MAERVNKFKQMYNTRKETTLTDELANQLYEAEEKQPEKKVVEKKVTEAPKQKVETIVVSPVEPVPVAPVTPATPAAPKKVGRPKKTGEDRVMFNFRIAKSKKEMVEIAATAKNLSMAEYLERLIEEDYARNQEYYDIVKANSKR